MGKLGGHANIGAKTTTPKAKGGLKLSAKGKANIGAKTTTPKAKGGLKLSAKGNANIGAKTTTPKAKVSAKAGAKAGLKVKVGAKKRRLQSATSNSAPQVESSPNGLDTAAYAGDVSVPTSLEGSPDQKAPGFSNLIKIALTSLAILYALF